MSSLVDEIQVPNLREKHARDSNYRNQCTLGIPTDLNSMSPIMLNGDVMDFNKLVVAEEASLVTIKQKVCSWFDTF